MEHVAIDLGSRESQICVRAEDGTILAEDKVGTRSVAKYLTKRPPSRVVVEACSEAFAVADAAKAAGHEVVVVPATLAPSLGVGDRGIKTDRRDSRNLSETSCRMSRLPSVHVPTAESRRRKSMAGMREALIQSRTKLINTVRGWARTQGMGVIKSGSPTTFSHRVRMHVGTQGQEPPEFVKRVLESIDELSVHINKADDELETLAQSDQTCQLMMTAPGVGPTVSVRYAAAVDEVGRFPNAHKVESYLGLTPGENSSSTRKRRTGVTKAGAVKLRWALIQAAWVARRYYKNDPMVLWSLEVEKRRGKTVAVTALARKLAGVLYAIWRDRKPYDRNHVTRALPAPA